jgi:predicted O-methyltransferase YrrM
MSLPKIKVAEAIIPAVTRRDTMMTRRERSILVMLLNNIEAYVVVEIGVHEGRCAKVMLDNVSSIQRYVGVDVLPGYVTSKFEQRGELPMVPASFVLGDQRFELILRSRGSLDLKAEDLPMCDVMLIDGDHGRAAIVHDTELARRRVRPGGLIIWHDYYIDGNTPLDVVATLEEWGAMGVKIEHIEGTWLAVMRNSGGALRE